MISVEYTVEGTIVASQLGTFGKDAIIYGYIGVKTLEGEQKLIKVDAYTWFETLEIGDDVRIEVSLLGDTKILVARKINVMSSIDNNSKRQVTVST